ncbi:D-alanine--D-alanine ligase [Lentibacillus halophilus]|uniref:D-alanine--D-alanine ligase n=1 Tax=Lentibacillus halophilus TaxID=295065 RepID=A0ABN0Z3P5_9BACI
MPKKTVGIIFGGKSAEHEVSLQSAKNIVDAIDEEKYKVVLIGIDKRGKWHINNPSSYLINADDPTSIRLNQSEQTVALVPGKTDHQLIHATDARLIEQLDAVFPIVHGTLGEDGSLQGMMHLANLPFVGTDVLGSAICMDKDIAKRLLQAAGLNVAKGLTCSHADRQEMTFAKAEKEVGVPMFIKPANQGSSVGVSKVSGEEAFDQALDEAFQYDRKVVIEETLNGREIECAVLGNDDPKASVPGEILPQTEFYSYESKYIDESGAKLEMPADLSDEAARKVQATAVKAFRTLECEGLARVDFFLTDDGDVYVNEVNTLPGFTRISMYPKLWELSGVAYPELIDQLIKLAIQRHERNSKKKSAVWDD